MAKQENRFLTALEKQIHKYELEHSDMTIITCDLNDVWRWIRKAKKKIK